MATTSMSLGSHWEQFIREEVSSGRYGSASEVIRDALRHLEEERAVRALRAHLSEGVKQADSGTYVDETREEMLNDFKGRQSA